VLIGKTCKGNRPSGSKITKQQSEESKTG